MDPKHKKRQNPRFMGRKRNDSPVEDSENESATEASSLLQSYNKEKDRQDSAFYVEESSEEYRGNEVDERDSDSDVLEITKSRYMGSLIRYDNEEEPGGLKGDDLGDGESDADDDAGDKEDDASEGEEDADDEENDVLSVGENASEESRGRYEHFDPDVWNCIKRLTHFDIGKERKAEFPHIQPQLHLYQAFAVGWLFEQPMGKILGDEMGLGKTATIITFLALKRDLRSRKAKHAECTPEECRLETVKATGRSDQRPSPTSICLKEAVLDRVWTWQTLDRPSLILVPATLIPQWQSEFKKFVKKNSKLKLVVIHATVAKREYEQMMKNMRVDRDGNSKYGENQDNVIFLSTIDTFYSRVMQKPDLLYRGDRLNPEAVLRFDVVCVDEFHEIYQETARFFRSIEALQHNATIPIPEPQPTPQDTRRKPSYNSGTYKRSDLIQMLEERQIYGVKGWRKERLAARLDQSDKDMREKRRKAKKETPAVDAIIKGFPVSVLQPVQLIIASGTPTAAGTKGLVSYIGLFCGKHSDSYMDAKRYAEKIEILRRVHKRKARQARKEEKRKKKTQTKLFLSREENANRIFATEIFQAITRPHMIIRSAASTFMCQMLIQLPNHRRIQRNLDFPNDKWQRLYQEYEDRTYTEEVQLMCRRHGVNHPMQLTEQQKKDSMRTFRGSRRYAKLRQIATVPKLAEMMVEFPRVQLTQESVRQLRANKILTTQYFSRKNMREMVDSSAKLQEIYSMVEAERSRQPKEPGQAVNKAAYFCQNPFMVLVTETIMKDLWLWAAGSMHQQMTTNDRHALIVDKLQGQGGNKRAATLDYVVGTYTLMAKGLNMTRLRTVYLLELAWSEAVEQQAAKRVHRQGQSRPTKCVALLQRDTCDEDVRADQYYDTVVRKRLEQLRRPTNASQTTGTVDPPKRENSRDTDEERHFLDEFEKGEPVDVTVNPVAPEDEEKYTRAEREKQERLEKHAYWDKARGVVRYGDGTIWYMPRAGRYRDAYNSDIEVEADGERGFIPVVTLSDDEE